MYIHAYNDDNSPLVIKFPLPGPAEATEITLHNHVTKAMLHFNPIPLMIEKGLPCRSYNGVLE
jgi:hypothetical protein